jgi:hypothetical protein
MELGKNVMNVVFQACRNRLITIASLTVGGGSRKMLRICSVTCLERGGTHIHTLTLTFTHTQTHTLTEKSRT